jgi:hypothetical protein
MKADEQFSILYLRCCFNEQLVIEIDNDRRVKKPFDMKKLKQIRENLNEAKRAEHELRKALR